MEWAVWTASSDSEDGVTQEKDEETGAPSNTGHQGSLCGVAEEASTKDAQGYINLPFIQKAASARNGWESMESVKAEAREKPPHKDIQDLVHFGKKDGNVISVPHCTRSTFTVNITAEDDISNHEPEVLATQAIDEDEEQVLVTQEDHGESSEELEYHSSTAEFGMSRTHNPRRSDVRRKKRNLTEDGPGQAYKLVKIERPQKTQVPSASAECVESTSDKTDSQWCESFQARHLEGNYAAEAPSNCVQSTERLSYSSEMAAHQAMNTGKDKYLCTVCNITYSSSARLKAHSLMHLDRPYKCPDCHKCCETEKGLGHHRTKLHSFAVPFKCTKCHLEFDSSVLLERHHHTDHGMGKKCPECHKRFKTEEGLGQHRTKIHIFAVPFKCTKCHLEFDSSMLLDRHHHTDHGMGKKCPECNQYFFEVDRMMQHLFIVHNAIARFHCAHCAITFNSVDELMMHEVACTGGGRIQCTVCHVKLKNALRLREHQTIVHKADVPLRLAEDTKAFAVDEPLSFPW